MYPELKENRPHGTDNYPYTQYHMHNIFHAFQIPVHWHDELEVIYTKKGPLNLLIDGKEYTAEDGSVYFVAPGQLHLMGSAAGDVDYYTLLFPLEFISFQSDDSLERELFFPLRNHTLSFPCKLPEDHDTAAKASVLLDQIINANSDRIAANQKRIPKPAWHPHSSPETCASYGRTGSVLSQPYQKHQQSPERVTVLYSAKLLFSYFPARSRRTFPYVRKYISRYFREHFQLTLSQYITYLRLSHAKHLLETTSLSITETALQSGFPNVSYFIRTFKNTFHVPPLQYRNSIR